MGDDNYLISVSAYIHNNPLKAGVVSKPQEYKWSSFSYYCGKENYKSGFVDTERILGLFSSNKKQSMEKYFDYVLKYEPNTEIIDVEEDKVILKKENVNYLESYQAAQEFLDTELQAVEKDIGQLATDKTLKKELIVKLRKNSCLTLAEIGQLVGGISPSMVCKILKHS